MTVSTSPVLSSAPSPSSSSSSSPEVITSITCMSVSVPRSWARLSSPPPASGSTSSAGPEASWSPRRRKLPPCFWALGWGIWGEDDYQMIIRKLRRQWSPPGPQLSLPRWLHEPEFIFMCRPRPTDFLKWGNLPSVAHSQKKTLKPCRSLWAVYPNTRADI